KRRVIIEQDYMVFLVYSDFSPVFELVGGSREINEIRSVKDEQEIEAIKAAQAITDAAFEYIKGSIKEGVTENDIVAELEYFMRKKGATTAFPSIIAFGAHSSMPHAVSGNTRLHYGEIVLLDFGAKLNGYCSDMTRTLFFGKPADELKRIYGIVLEAQTRAINSMYEGILCRDADAVARKFIEDSGYGNAFGHGLGHGLGVECHEAPRLSPKSTWKLLANMVVTVEPGIYLPGVGGIRIENMCVIRKTAELLTQSDNRMMIL
ncbi:MAG TPA: M24 family metallopeptidase, partial [Clostridia bacterium]|nr:M24 family metallopeptidase [Clostridia bacterium]